jgi:hypothetical protein
LRLGLPNGTVFNTRANQIHGNVTGSNHRCHARRAHGNAHQPHQMQSPSCSNMSSAASPSGSAKRVLAHCVILPRQPAHKETVHVPRSSDRCCSSSPGDIQKHRRRLAERRNGSSRLLRRRYRLRRTWRPSDNNLRRLYHRRTLVPERGRYLSSSTRPAHVLRESSAHRWCHLIRRSQQLQVRQAGQESSRGATSTLGLFSNPCTLSNSDSLLNR